MPRPSASLDLELGIVLRRLRAERGESQETLGYKAGITSGSLARIELGQSNPAWATVRDIAAALDVTMAYLASEVEKERA
jgi:transcriptional regulator with XRE-family HTH domain